MEANAESWDCPDVFLAYVFILWGQKMSFPRMPWWQGLLKLNMLVHVTDACCHRDLNAGERGGRQMGSFPENLAQYISQTVQFSAVASQSAVQLARQCSAQPRHIFDQNVPSAPQTPYKTAWRAVHHYSPACKVALGDRDFLSAMTAMRRRSSSYSQ